MSELIAEARVLVTPDTTQFRRLLDAEITAATKTPVTVPVKPVLVGGAATTAGASVTADVEKGAAAATASAARLDAQRAAFLAKQTTAETAASTKRIAAREAEVQALLAEERKLALQQQALEAQRVTTGTAESSRRIAQREKEIEGILAEERRLLLQEQKFEADRVTAATAASSARIAAREREVAGLLAADRKSAASATAAAEKQAAASAAGLERQLGGLSKGGASAAASLLGVRGATLAATGPFIAGAAGAIAFGKAIGIATGFNSQLAVFAATTGATADQMERVSAAAKELGKDITLPGVSASDAAEAMTEFAKAGLSVNDAIAATRGGLQLATAAQLSNADAVTLTANALNSFKLSGDQAVNVADTLANAANSAQGSIADIGLGLRQSASAAAAVGVSFEDTTALLTLLAKNGLTASDAGTSLRTAFIRLVNPSKAAAKILSDLNVTLRDAQGNVRPEVFAEFAEAQKNLSRATQDANTAIVFGQDAFRAQAVLGREGVQSLNATRDALEEQGTAARVAGARMVGLAGATANLKNQLESLGLSIGQTTTPALQVLVDNLADVVSGLNSGVSAAKDFASSISGIGSGQDQQDDPFKQVKQIGSFLAGTNFFNIKSQIEKLVEGPKEEMLTAGAEIASAIEDSGRIAARGAVSFGDQITGALDAAFALVQRSIREGKQKIRTAQLQATAGGAGQQAGLEEQFSGILASGGSLQAQIANLQRQAQVQGKIIEEAGPNAAGVLLERRRAARSKLASIQQQITGIEKGIAADAKAAQDEQQRVRDDAARAAKAASDAAFLQTQQNARDSAERLIGLAGDTPGLADDIRRQQQQRVLLTKQIAGIKASALDEAAKASAIRALTKARQATTDEINRLVVEDREQKQAQKKEAAEALASARLELAQTTFDLTGAKAPLERAFDAEIKRQIGLKNAAKKGSVAFIEAQTAIRRLLKQKKDLNDEVKDAAQDVTGGTTLVDLFNENQRIFDQIGNVGQSAAGLTTHAQNASISAIVQHKLEFGGSPAMTAQQRATDALTRAIVDLTNKLSGDNLSLGVPAAQARGNRPGFGRALTQEERFRYQHIARAMVAEGLNG